MLPIQWERPWTLSSPIRRMAPSPYFSESKSRMTFSKKPFLILALVGFALRLLAADSTLVFTHATVIDATGRSPQPNVTLVITNNRIASLHGTTEVAFPTNAVIVNAAGKYIIPGLWDMHVHWYSEDYLPLFIANGVTGIRIMFGFSLHHEWRKKVEQGALVGPHMYIASTLVDGPSPIWPGSLSVTNAEDGRHAVSRAIAEGADFVKVYSVLPREGYFAIADEAKKRNIPFVGHVPETVSVEEASRAGQKSIEHLTGVLKACSTRESEFLKASLEMSSGVLSPDKVKLRAHLWRQQDKDALECYSQARSDRLFEILRKNHTWQCPTLIVQRNVSHLDDGSITNDVRLRYVPQSIKAMWDPSNDVRLKAVTPEEWAAKKSIYQKEFEIVGAMQRAGVEMLAGTDTGNPYCFPGFSLHDELALLVEAGLTPMQALQGATRNAARFMGKEMNWELLKPGKLADLVLLDADPLAGITNSSKIAAVVYGGKLFTKAALQEILSKAQALASKVSIGETLRRTLLRRTLRLPSGSIMN